MEPIYPPSGLPSTITVFSAPNYCDIYGNKGSILHIIDDKLDVVQFGASPHPFTLPNFMSVFEWSVPFVAEKVSELLHSIVADDEDPTLSPPSQQVTHTAAAELVEKLQLKIEHDAQSAHTLHRLKAKVRTLGRMLSVMRQVRQQREGALREGIRVHTAPELITNDPSDDEHQEVADERGSSSPRRSSPASQTPPLKHVSSTDPGPASTRRCSPTAGITPR
jgi:hypothetical protein